ncbi:MAG: Ig-like domain-containing protein, partial [Rhodoferax sp.]|nr:Ig-like domain-containing protein [Rhodoferax sp.]
SFDATDISITGGTLGSLTGSGSVRTATFTPAADTDTSLASITVDADRYTDAIGNKGGAGATPLLTLDTKAPRIAATPTLELLHNGTPATANLVRGDTIVLSIDLGEAASGLMGLPSTGSSNSSSIQIGGTAKAGAVWSISGNTLLLSYTVVPGDIGSISVDLATLKAALGSSITDSAGNPATLGGDGGGGGGVWSDSQFTPPPDPTLQVNAPPPPTVSSFVVSDAGNSNGTNLGAAGEAVHVEVHFSQAVTFTASSTYTVHVQIGSNANHGFDAYFISPADNPADNPATSIYTFGGTLPSTMGLSSNALQLTWLTVPDGAAILDASNTPLAQSSYTLQSNAYTVDSTAPTPHTLSLGTGVADGATAAEASAATGVVHVMAESGSTVLVTFTDSASPTPHSIVKTLTGTGAAVGVTLSSTDLGSGNAGLQDGSISVSATATDLAGNVSTAGSSLQLDTLIATPTLAPGSGVTGEVSWLEAIAATGVVSVMAESGSTVLVTFTDSASPTPHSIVKTVTGTGAAVGVTLSSTDLGSGNAGLLDGSISVSATATDLAGNVSTAGSSSFGLETVPPRLPTLALGSGVSGGATAAEATAASGVVSVNAESGCTVLVTFTDSASPTGNSIVKTITGTGLDFGVTLDSSDIGSMGNMGNMGSLQDGTITVTATTVDTTGNTNTAGSSFRLDTVIATPTLQPLANHVSLARAIASGGITIQAESGSSVLVTFTDSSKHSVTKRITGTGMPQAVVLSTGDIGLGTNQLHDGSITVRAVATDLAGNTSQPGVSGFTLDTAPPAIRTTALTVLENVRSIGGLEKNNFFETANWAMGVDAYDNALFTLDTTVGILYWASPTGRDFEAATKSAAGTNTYTITVTATDAAGNQSSTQTITITLADDNEAPVNSTPATTPQTPLLVPEDSFLAWSGSNLISVWDPDAGSNGIASVSLLVQHGTLSVTPDAPQGGLAGGSISNNGTATVTLTGSAAAINATLATLIYRPNANYNGTDMLTVFTSDGGIPAALSASSSVHISVSAVTDPPTLTGIPTSTANITLGTPAALDNFRVADADDNNNNGTPSTLYVTLTPSNGSISGLLDGTDAASGLMTHTAMDGSIQLTGTAAAINARLALITFTASATGAASMAVDVSDVALLGEAGNSSSHASGTYHFSVGNLPVPMLSFDHLQDGILNAADTHLAVQLSMVGLADGDTVQLQLDGINLGSAYSVTASDASAGKAILNISKSSLGSDTLAGSSKALTAVVTKNGADSPASNALNLTLDSTLPTVSLSLGAGVANGASMAEVTASTGVLSLCAESGSRVMLSFTNQDNTRINRVMTGTGLAQAITLTAAEIGANSNQLHDGSITVNAVAVDQAGNVNTAVSSFVLDTQAPPAAKTYPMHWSQGWIPVGSTPRADKAESVETFSPSAPIFQYSQSGMTATAGFAQFSAEPGATVQVKYYSSYFSSSQAANLSKTFTYTGDGNTLQALSLTSEELASLNTSKLDLEVYVTDAAGNRSPATRMTYQLNPTEVPAPILAMAAGVSKGANLAKATAGAITETVAAGLLVSNTFVDAFGHSVTTSYTSTDATTLVASTIVDWFGNSSTSTYLSSGATTSVGLPAAAFGTGAGQLRDGPITVTAIATDAFGNLAPTSSINFVLDTTAPKLVAATLAANRGSMVLTFTETLDNSANSALTLAAANSLLVFKTSTSGNSAISSPYSAISVNGNTVTLTLTTALTDTETASVQYLAPAGEQSSGVVQDTAGNDMATLATAVNLSALPVVSGFSVSDSGNSNGSNLGKASEGVAVQLNFSETVTLSANTTYTAHVQIGSSASDGFDATLVTTSVPTASNSYTFSGTLPSSFPSSPTGLSSNALTLTSLTMPNGKPITGSTSNLGSRAVAQSSYTLSSNSYQVDSIAPALQSIDFITPTNASNTSILGMMVGVTPIVAFHFSEDPGSSFAWDGSYGDITVTGGTLSALWGAGQKRYATFVPTPNTNNGLASISV